MSSEIARLQREYADLVEYANSKIKLAESTIRYKNKTTRIQGILIPAINELRSSASHIARAFKQTSQEEIISSYHKAINLCARAAFDAIEATVAFFLTRCARFQLDYSLLVLDTIPESYQEDCIYIESIKRKFPSKESCTENNYTVYFDELEAILERLQTIDLKWEVARPELNKKRIVAIVKIFLKTISVASIIATIFYYIYSIFH